MNFIASFKNKTIGNQYVGIEYFSVDNEDNIAILLVDKKNRELIPTKEDLRIFKDSVFKNLDKKRVYNLVINSNQVVQKEIQETEGADSKLLHKAFPNIKWEDFYYSIWRLKSKSIISITRKSVVDDIINKFKSNEIFIFHICIGNSPLSVIFDIVNQETLETNKHILNFDYNKDLILPRDIKTSIDYEINGLKISNKHLLAFSVTLQSILNRKLTSGNLDSLNLSLKDNFFQKQFFTKGIQTGIGVLLILLLFNFFFFTNYYKKVEENSKTLEVNHSSQQVLSKLKLRIKLKEETVKKIYSNSNISCVAILNNITKDIPSSILLSELTYQPLQKKIKEEEAILIDNKAILITGATINTEIFTNWIESLEKISFVDKVVITHFGKNENLETTFSLKLLINETK
ncbi:general secretion pathway protein [Flavobacterium sp. H122]|uniref:general secretion pathway protein n=1 Tax=Flavobacterium sp. H122 TaxID=2529860 RepID=UPI0010A997D7|nr:general secretion pathway protein [Flavobacterium sp. H122]